MKKTYKYVSGTPLTDEQRKRIQALALRPPSEIDTSDIPELTDEDFKYAIRGGIYRATKLALSMRLDSDVLAWLKKDGDGYQTRANQILRERMLQDLKERRKDAA